jgi:hypothetical protein
MGLVPRKHHLRLMNGGQSDSFRLGSATVVRLWGEPLVPAGAGAVVLEEDTLQVLGAPVELCLPTGHPVRVITEAYEAQPVPPGAVLVRGERPLALLAVVHDLDREPSWEEAWIAAALRAVLEEAARRNIRGLALPLLGTVHGRLDPARAVALTWEALREAERPPERIWLQAPPNELPIIREQIVRIRSEG